MNSHKAGNVQTKHNSFLLSCADPICASPTLSDALVVCILLGDLDPACSVRQLPLLTSGLGMGVAQNLQDEASGLLCISEFRA